MANNALNAESRSVADDHGGAAVAPRRMWFEALLIFSLFFLYTGGPPPDVNETHYLPKAKHYWNPDWCGPDVFLDSADPHTVFYWMFGWMTLWGALGTVAWIGRVVTWGLLAIGWQRLSWAVFPRRYVSVLTVALLLALSNRCHLAGEWFVGGLEAKGIAYALVFFALRCIIRGQWRAVWLWLGAASAVHVLVGGWSVVAAAVCWWSSGSARPPLRGMWGSLVLGVCMSLAGLIPALMLSVHVDPRTANEANEIYVFGRLAHHLVFHRFAWQRMMSFGLLLVMWIALWSVARRSLAWNRLNWFAFASLLISCIGVILDFALLTYPQLAARLLKFYWFRLSDVALPLAVALAVPVVIRGLSHPHRSDSRASAPRPRLARWAWTVAVVAPGLSIGWRYVESQIDFRPPAIIQTRPVGRHGARRMYDRYRAWRNACAWIADETDPHSRFLTPRNQQTFKWYAGRAEVVCWKDIPQDAASVVKWWQLMGDIYTPDVIQNGLGAWTDQQLYEIARREQVDYILVDRSRTRRRLGFHRVYPSVTVLKPHFELYRVDGGSERVSR